MSSFGAFGGGGSFGTFGPGDGGNNQSVGSNAFGPFYDLVMSQGAQQNAPMGYNYNPGTGNYERRSGQTFSNPFGSVLHTRSGPASGSGPSGFDQYQGGAMADYMALFDANEQNYGNRMAAAEDARQSFVSGAEDIRQAGINAQQDLYGFAGDLQQKADDFYSGIGGRVDESIAGFEDLGAAQASSISAGLAQQERNQNRAIDAAAKEGRPDAIAAQYQRDMDADARRSQVMVQQASAFNQGLSNLRMQGAQSMTAAGGVMQGMQGLAANLNQMGSSVYQATQAEAARFEAQGYTDYANFIAANPYSPVAFLPTLTSLFQFSQTPGSAEFSGFGPDLYTA